MSIIVDQEERAYDCQDLKHHEDDDRSLDRELCCKGGKYCADAAHERRNAKAGDSKKCREVSWVDHVKGNVHCRQASP